MSQKAKYRVLADQRWHTRKDGSPNILFRAGDIVEASEIFKEPDFHTYPLQDMEGLFVAPSAPNAERNLDNLDLDSVCGMRSYCKGEQGCFVPLDQLEVVNEIVITGTQKPIEMEPEVNKEERKSILPVLILAGVAFVLFKYVALKS